MRKTERPLSLLLLVSLLLSNTARPTEMPSPQLSKEPLTEEISYRLLKSDRRQFGKELSVANYAVSVDCLLDRPQVEQLICRVLQNERPAPFSILSIEIFYKLDKSFAAIGLESQGNKRRQYGLAGYLWNMKLPNQQDRLMVYRDVQGNILDPPKFYYFDHTKACK